MRAAVYGYRCSVGVGSGSGGEVDCDAGHFFRATDSSSWAFGFYVFAVGVDDVFGHFGFEEAGRDGVGVDVARAEVDGEVSGEVVYGKSVV